MTNLSAEDLRAHARAYERDLTHRAERRTAILAGEYPRLDDVLSGLPSLGGSLARDVRATATLLIEHLTFQSHHTISAKLGPALEKLERIPSASTLKAVWKIVGALPHRHAVFPKSGHIKLRFAWYLALLRDVDAIEQCAVLIGPTSDFFRRAYLAGLVSAQMHLDPIDAPADFQNEILAYGVTELAVLDDMLDRYLPFATERLNAQDVLAAERSAEEEAEDREIEEEAVRICNELRSPPAPQAATMHQVLHPVEGHKTSEKRDVSKMYEPLTRPLPLHKFGYQSFRQVKRDWPHAASIISAIEADLRFNTAIRFRPVLLVGGPGTGKTSLALAIAETLGLRSIVYPCASSSDNSFGGTPSRWSTASASTPLELIRQAGVANPIVILDEIEKGGHHHSGNLEHALLPFLEPHTASRYHETALDMSADLSTVNYVATCNSLEIPAPLRDRFRIMRMPDPGPEHVGAIVRRIVQDIAMERGMAEPPLVPDEIDVVSAAWKAGSLRKLKRAVEICLETRDRLEVRQ